MVISGSAVTSNFLQFHASAMTLFLRSIWCICREFIDAVDYICQLSLSIHWWFQGLLLLCFRWWFMNLQWHSVFDNSMRQPWLYFCYRFDASVVSSRTLAIPYVRCHSFFSDDFNVYRDSVFANDLRTNSDIAFLTIPSINLDSIFAINLMRRQWIHWRCQFSCNLSFHDDFKVYKDVVFADVLWISRDKVFFTIPCVDHDSIFAIDLTRR